MEETLAKVPDAGINFKDTFLCDFLGVIVSFRRTALYYSLLIRPLPYNVKVLKSNRM